MNFRYTLLLIMIVLVAAAAGAQDSTIVLPGKTLVKYADKISSKTGELEKKLDKKTEKLLGQFQKQEVKIKKRLEKTDSLKAAKVFGDAESQYNQLKKRLDKNTAQIKEYIPSLDTLSSSIKFLQQNSQMIASAKETQQKLDEALGKVRSLENQFQKAEELKRFLKQRRQYLKEQLTQLGFAKQLKKLNKQAYYYGQQLNEYKALLKDRKRLEKKVMGAITKTKLFNRFMQKNGQLAGLFRLPMSESSMAGGANIAGLQSRAQVQNALQSQVGIPGISAQQRLQQGLGQAQSQLNQLKQKAQQFAGNSSDFEIPDFNPNPQKTKSFIQKLEFSADVQSTKHNNLFPVSSDIGLSIGFKPSEKLITGLGASYKIGWGSGFNHIQITHQGVGLRSFCDFKVKGSFFLSAGYEQNYFAVIKDIDQLRDLNAWKSSALFGLSKKYKIGSKRKGEIKLLYDFFYFRQAPRTQPLLFRVGFGL